MAIPSIEDQIAQSYKPIQFPKVRRLEELFTGVEPRKLSGPAVVMPPVFVWAVGLTCDCGACKRSGRCELSSYCGVRGQHKSFDAYTVLPTAEVIAKIGDKMLIRDREVLHFNVVFRQTTALVTCDYNLITGGIWLALMPLESAQRSLRAARRKGVRP